MKHFIYKTTHTNGKYYIGRHSTENLDDGYIGSGLWPLSIKDKTALLREILAYADDDISLKLLEEQFLLDHFGKEGCMNRTTDSVGFSSQNNPMKDPDIVAKISGDNHWLRKHPERGEEISKRQLEKVELGTHPLQGDRNPNKDGRNAKAAMKNGKHVWLADNPSIHRSAEGIHHWQNGNAPNFDGKQNKRLVEEGTHNFLGPEQNKKRVDSGTHNFLGSDANMKRLAEGTHPSQSKETCQYCQKTVSVGMFTRWHGDKCKLK